MRELVWYARNLVGFENRLKERDRIKDKVAESLAVKGRTLAEAMKLIPDAIRYTFQYHAADYSRHLLGDIALTRERFSDLVRLRNFWRADQYKGISSLWRHHEAGQLFEMQFHTEVSFHAMMFTAERSYARLRSAQTCAQEEIELQAFQREVYAHVPIPPDAYDIPCYPDRIDSRIPGRGNARSRPRRPVSALAVVAAIAPRLVRMNGLYPESAARVLRSPVSPRRKRLRSLS